MMNVTAARYMLRGPVTWKPHADLAARAATNADLFRSGHDLFVRHLDQLNLHAPIHCEVLTDLDIEAGNQWNRVRKQENKRGIANLLHFAAGVPFKVGIWIDESGRFTDLRFGHWGVHSLHVGSSIYTAAHAVAFIMPHQNRAIPMEVYLTDINKHVRTTMKAWLAQYTDAHRWYANMDRYFGVTPFARWFLERRTWAFDLVTQSNLAHFDALRAPLLKSPLDNHRVIPGNDADHISAPHTRNAKRMPRRQDEIAGAPRVVHLNALNRAASLDQRSFIQRSAAHANAALFEAGLNLYRHRMRAKEIPLPAMLAALSPLRRDAEDLWGRESPETFVDLWNLASFHVGIPFKAGLWFDTVGRISNIRFSQWDSLSLHLGSSINGPSDAVAYLIPYGDSFIPLRAVVTAAYAQAPTKDWLACYKKGQQYFRNLSRRFSMSHFLTERRASHRATNTLCAISGVCHLKEVQAPSLGWAENFLSEIVSNAAAHKVIAYRENESWFVSVPEGQTVEIDDVTCGAGVHEAPVGAILTSGGQRYHLNWRVSWM